MRTPFLILVLIFSVSIAGCLNQTGKSDSSSTDGSGQQKAPISALEATKTLSASGLKFYTLNGGTLTGNENTIRVCTSGNEYCWSGCIASYFPDRRRYSLFRTDFLLGSKCAASLLSYPDNSGLPAPFYYWQGQYASSRCSINLSSPTFLGRSTFTEVRVPEGQPTPSNGMRVYYRHDWFDMNSIPYANVDLLNYVPPSYFNFKDTNFTTSDINMALANGFSCIKLEEVGNAFQ
jgi:hypothetical protein